MDIIKGTPYEVSIITLRRPPRGALKMEPITNQARAEYERAADTTPTDGD